MSLVKPLRFCSKCQQEALAREQLLENKLAALQRLVGQTESASSDAWKSLIDEVSIFPDLSISLGATRKVLMIKVLRRKVLKVLLTLDLT